jgi:tRNA dimethylallyltransferase
MKKQKIVIVLGPTSSGKSELAVYLSKKFNGEIISADSRQVYKKMDIGTGKISKKEMKNIPHYMISIASPKRQFSAERFKKLATKYLKKIIKKNKLPIICGGTGFYIDSLIYNLQFPKVKPNIKLRKELEKLTNEELLKKLKKIDKRRAEEIDKNNKRRIIRAIEIATITKKPIEKIQKKEIYQTIKIGIERKNLKKLINKRINERIKQGLINEVKKLRKEISWKKLENFGLEYKQISKFLQKKISKEEMIKNIKNENYQYAKRQMTWFKKDKEIHWIKNKKQAEKILRIFLNKKPR